MEDVEHIVGLLCLHPNDRNPISHAVHAFCRTEVFPSPEFQLQSPCSLLVMNLSLYRDYLDWLSARPERKNMIARVLLVADENEEQDLLRLGPENLPEFIFRPFRESELRCRISFLLHRTGIPEKMKLTGMQNDNYLLKYVIEHEWNAIALYDREMNHIYVSQKYMNDYHVEEKEIIGRNHYEVFPDIPERWKEIHKRAINGEVLRSNFDVFPRKDGSVDWVRWECRPWYTNSGAIGGMVLYSEVINDWIQREEEIKRLNSRLEILVDSIKEFSTAHELSEVYHTAVSAARRLTDAESSAMIIKEGDTCQCVDEDASEPLLKGQKVSQGDCIADYVLSSGKPMIVEDMEKDLQITKEPFKNIQVKSLAIFPIHSQVTLGAMALLWRESYSFKTDETRLIETLLDAASQAIENINLYKNLEERVKIRTKDLEKANEELQAFSYTVSHDLKAPIRAIDGYIDLMMDELGEHMSKESQSYATTIRSSVVKMNQLIDDLLRYSRFDKSSAHIECVAVLPVIRKVMDEFKDQIEQSGAICKLPVESIRVIADETGLTVVLRNLVDNALKFSRSRPQPHIAIALEDIPGYWMIVVQDNGIGFEMTYRNKIFDVFERLHGGKEYPGSGIGLALVKKAMLRMNGMVWAESKPGIGSKFFLRFPKITPEFLQPVSDNSPGYESSDS